MSCHALLHLSQECARLLAPPRTPGMRTSPGPSTHSRNAHVPPRTPGMRTSLYGRQEYARPGPLHARPECARPLLARPSMPSHDASTVHGSPAYQDQGPRVGPDGPDSRPCCMQPNGNRIKFAALQHKCRSHLRPENCSGRFRAGVPEGIPGAPGPCRPSRLSAAGSGALSGPRTAASPRCPPCRSPGPLCTLCPHARQRAAPSPPRERPSGL